jgi:hypothetical protein
MVYNQFKPFIDNIFLQTKVLQASTTIFEFKLNLKNSSLLKGNLCSYNILDIIFKVKNHTTVVNFYWYDKLIPSCDAKLYCIYVHNFMLKYERKYVFVENTLSKILYKILLTIY